MTKPIGPSKRSKKHGIKRKSATRPKATAKRSPAQSLDPAPLNQALSTRPARSDNPRTHRGSVTSGPQRLQELREGTLEQSDLMPEHVHFDFPGMYWVDKSKRPPWAIDRGPDSQGAWVCNRFHAWGQYIRASTKGSCAGCGDSSQKGERMPWDLEHGGKEHEGYVINVEKKDIAYIPQCHLKDKLGSFPEGRQPNKRAARMRIFLKRMYAAATEQELRQYWSRPFE